MLKLDPVHAVLIAIIGVSIALIGLVFLLVDAFLAGGLLLALGSVAGGIGIRQSGT